MLAVTEIIRQMNQGQTAPFLCKADDGHLYIVKGARATPKGLIKEWIAAHLCKEFGLPCPEFSLVYVDDALVEYGYSDLGSGMCFASKFVPNIQDVTFSQLQKVSKQILQDLFVFDYWIKNDDRCLTQLGGNPNLFFEPLSNQLFVLDHNLSFEPSFSLTNHCELHVGRMAWFEPQQPLLAKSYYEERILSSIAILQEAIDSLPQEWLKHYDLDSINREIIVVLEQYKSEKFWEDIK
jgi:hypothetical protein